MLIGRVEMTPTGIAIHDVDGSCVDLSVRDARELAKWLDEHSVELWKLTLKLDAEAKQATQEQKEKQV